MSLLPLLTGAVSPTTHRTKPIGFAQADQVAWLNDTGHTQPTHPCTQLAHPCTQPTPRSTQPTHHSTQPATKLHSYHFILTQISSYSQLISVICHLYRTASVLHISAAELLISLRTQQAISADCIFAGAGVMKMVYKPQQGQCAEFLEPYGSMKDKTGPFLFNLTGRLA